MVRRRQESPAAQEARRLANRLAAAEVARQDALQGLRGQERDCARAELARAYADAASARLAAARQTADALIGGRANPLDALFAAKEVRP